MMIKSLVWTRGSVVVDFIEFSRRKRPLEANPAPIGRLALCSSPSVGDSLELSGHQVWSRFLLHHIVASNAANS